MLRYTRLLFTEYLRRQMHQPVGYGLAWSCWRCSKSRRRRGSGSRAPHETESPAFRDAAADGRLAFSGHRPAFRSGGPGPGYARRRARGGRGGFRGRAGLRDRAHEGDSTGVPRDRDRLVHRCRRLADDQRSCRPARLSATHVARQPAGPAGRHDGLSALGTRAERRPARRVVGGRGSGKAEAAEQGPADGLGDPPPPRVRDHRQGPARGRGQEVQCAGKPRGRRDVGPGSCLAQGIGRQLPGPVPRRLEDQPRSATRSTSSASPAWCSPTNCSTSRPWSRRR